MIATPVESRVMLRLNSDAMRRLREEKKLIQTDAAKLAGMTPSRWNDIENGGRTNVTVETLGKIADALGCDPSDLLTPPEPTKKPRRLK